MRFQSIPLLSTAASGSHIKEYTYDRLSFMRRAVIECGSVGRASFQGRHVLIASGPEPIHEILVEKAKAFRKWPLIRLVLYPLIGDGLFTSEGLAWRTQRRIMAPIFRHEQIASFAECMTEVANRSASTMRDGATVPVADETTRIAMSIVGKALFDADTFDEADELAHALTVALKWTDEQVSSIPVAMQILAREVLEGVVEKRQGWPRRAAERALAYLETPLRYRLSFPTSSVRMAVDTIDRRITKMISDRRAAGLHRNDLLTQLLRARGEGDGAALSDRQVRDQAVNLFIGGHETTATGLAWAFHELAKNPDIYARVQAEADRFAGRTPTREELPQLATCMRVFKESLRMYPPVYAYGRQALTDVTIGGYEVPAGTAVLASAYGLHHNPAVYPNPERFDPDRFTPEAEAARHRSAYIPFGNGPRICIGNHFGLLEGQLVLAALSHRVRFEAQPGAQVRPEPAATLRPNGGMPMIARLRNDARTTAPVPQQGESQPRQRAANEH